MEKKHEEIIKKMKEDLKSQKKSSQEARSELIKSGIYTQKGNLKAKYR